MGSCGALQKLLDLSIPCSIIAGLTLPLPCHVGVYLPTHTGTVRCRGVLYDAALLHLVQA